MILKLMPPALWLSIIMVAWGVVMTLMGIVQSYGVSLLQDFVLASPRFIYSSTYLQTRD
jgi:hypothetical protein